MDSPSPLVTVAIPLYRSGRFVDIISENIRALPAGSIEILLSDRHGDDDAMATLKTIFADDSRICYLQATDRIDWVDHYNWLLKQAKGRYFMWMPHDDSFPAGYVSALVHDLEANPTAWLSFGDIIQVNADSDIRKRMFLPHLLSYQLQHWKPLLALELLCFWNMGIPFRGVFNRQRVLERGLFIKKIKNSPDFADVYWVFGLSLQGRLWYNDAQYCLKRYHAHNTHTRWKLSDYFLFAHAPRRVLDAYIDDARLSVLTTYSLKAALRLIIYAKKVYHFILPEFIRSPVRARTINHHYSIPSVPASTPNHSQG